MLAVEDPNDLLPDLTSFSNPFLPVPPTAFTAGDRRATEMPGLATMHTLFLREHNRIAAIISSTNSFPGLSAFQRDEEIYQRARRAVIAQTQKIVYNDYLPLVIGFNRAQADGLILTNQRTAYDNELDPSIINSFATAAYRYVKSKRNGNEKLSIRFGHSMIRKLIGVFTFQSLPHTSIQQNNLASLFFNMNTYVGPDGVSRILAGLIRQVKT